MPSTVSVIVVNHQGARFLPRLFDSLRAQTVPPAEVVLVDNASTDGSVALTRAQYPEVRVIEMGANTGFAVANNVGADASRGAYIALINSDAYADPDWLRTLADVLDRNASAGAAVGKIYYTGPRRVFDQAGARFNNVGNFWGRGHLEADAGQYDEECEVPGLTACAALVRRDALAGEPLFDPDFFMYGEELDLTLRLRGCRWNIVYTPSAIAFHEGMGSLKAVDSAPGLFQQLHATRNRIKVVMRFYPVSELVRSLPLLLVNLAYWSFVFLRDGGVAALARALRGQIAYAWRGLRMRRRTRADAALWLPWMERQSIREMLHVRRTMQRGAAERTV